MERWSNYCLFQSPSNFRYPLYWQLCNPKVRKMAELLEKTNSSYCPAFKNLFRDAVSGR